MCADLQWLESRTEAEILIGLTGIHQLARIHTSVRVPQRFELGERPDQLVAKHLWIQRRASLTVPVFAEQRAAIPNAQVGALVKEASEIADSLFGDQVEVDARMDACLAEMSVKRCPIRVAVEKHLELAQV